MIPVVKRVAIAAGVAVGLSFPVILAARAQAPNRFAAVSIKLFKPGEPLLVPGQWIVADPAGLHITGRPLPNLIRYAYNIYAFQLTGPHKYFTLSWSPPLDLDGSTSAPATEDQLRVMLQQVLADRFGLRLTRQEKSVAVYAVVVAKGGPKLRKLAPGQQPDLVMPPVGMMARRYNSIQEFVDFSDSTMAYKVLGRPLIDETGLTGHYNINFSLPVEKGTYRGHGVWLIHWQDLPTALKPLGLELKPETVALPFYTIQSAHPPGLN